LKTDGETMKDSTLWTTLSFLVLLTFASWHAARANTIDAAVSLDTSLLIGSAAGPFELAFILTDGSGTSDANNTITLSNFAFGGGSAGATDNTLSGGGESGSLLSGVSLIDSSFFNVFASSFTPGNTLSFLLSLTTNVDAAAPDQFSFILLQGDGSAVNTSDSSGANSLLTVNIDSSSPSIATFASDLTPAPIISATVPEPPSGLLMAAALCVATYMVRKKRAGPRVQTLIRRPTIRC